MPQLRNLDYAVINQGFYHGEGHIINIAKRHTNRRWRQYTPEKECNIQLEMVKKAIIHAIELKGFGTFIVEISFKDIDNKLVTKLKYNFNFEDQAIKQQIVCQSAIKFVDIKLINNQTNPRRMGINHFFMKGSIIKQEGEESDDSQQQRKKKKRKGAPNQVWVREKIQGGDPWGLDQVESQEEPEWKVKGGELVENVKVKGRRIKGNDKKNLDNLNFTLQQKQTNYKRQHPTITFIKNQISVSQNTEILDISKSRKLSKPNQTDDDDIAIGKDENSNDKDQIKLQLSNTLLARASETATNKGLFSIKFQKKFSLTNTKTNFKQSAVNNKFTNEQKALSKRDEQQTQQQKKHRVKLQLIQKLKANMGSLGH